MKDHKILISLDCLVDTRLACVIYQNPDWATALVEKGYISRLHNTFSKINSAIDDKIIEDIWDNRTADILPLARPTNMVKLLSTYILQSTINEKHPSSLNYKITINTYPYDLTKYEIKEYFECFLVLLNTKNITRVHAPPSDITPQYLKGHFDRFIYHDFNEWSVVQQSNIIENPIPLITIAVPLCCVKGKEDLTDELTAERETRKYFSNLLDLEFYRLADISINI